MSRNEPWRFWRVLLTGLLAWPWLTFAQPPAGVCAPQAATCEQGQPDEAEECAGHESLFTPYVTAPGRPDWAPLDMLWGKREWTPPLLDRLSADDPVERARAAVALGLIGAQRARKSLADALRDPEAAVRRRAGLALCYLGDARGKDEAAQVLKNGEV